MALTALERLDLMDALDSLLEQAKTAKGLDLLDISDEIDTTLVKLGYAPGSSETPPPPPAADVAPEIVTKFLAGDYSAQSDDDFVTTLNTLDQYVGVFLTLDDVKAGAITWINKRPAQSA
ncbi:ddrA [Enterobacter soli]|uniref:ddrA n=1 Tax=Enterobacter soli TaxID=885040 RepID=UPI002F413179